MGIKIQKNSPFLVVLALPVLTLCGCAQPTLANSKSVSNGLSQKPHRQVPAPDNSSSTKPTANMAPASQSTPVSNVDEILGSWETDKGFVLRIDNVRGRLHISGTSRRLPHRFSFSGIAWDGHTLAFVLHNLTIDHRVFYRLAINDRGYLGGTFQELKPQGMVAMRGGVAFRKIE